MTNICVTGGLGFLGSNYCINNINNFNKVIIIDRGDFTDSKNTIIDEILDKVILIKKDIKHCKLLDILVEYKINIVIHFAAQTHVDNSYNGFFSFVEDNIVVTHILLETIKNYIKYGGKIERILMMSTDEVYGSNDENFYETSILNPTNPYAASKASAEMIINAYKYSYNLPIIIMRCNNIYGPRQYPDKVIPKFILQIYKGENVSLHGNGNKVRDFIYVDDVCEAINCILDKGKIGEIYNIGVNNPYTIINLAKILAEKINKNLYISYVEDRPFNDNRYFVNVNKLKSLGWKEKVDWEEGLERTIQWLLNSEFNTIKSGYYSPKDEASGSI